MSLLQLSGRPWTVFNPNNKKHRRAYADFVKYGTWSRCIYRFIVNEDHNNLVTIIQRKLVEYYVVKEFKLNSAKVL